MKTLSLYLILFCTTLYSFAQPANFKQAEAAKKLQLPWKTDKISPFFTEDSDDFWFVKQNEDGEHYYYVDFKANKIDEFIDTKNLAEELNKITGRKYNPQKIGLWKIQFKKGGELLSWRDGDYIMEYNRKTRKLTYKTEKLDYGAYNYSTQFFPGYSPDKNYQVIGKMHNAYLRNEKDSSLVQLTFDGEPGYTFTDDDENLSSEMPLSAVWFDDSKNFCLYRQDIRNIGKVAYVNYLKGRPEAYSSETVLAGDSVVIKNEVYVVSVNPPVARKVKIDKWQDQQTRVLHTDTKANKLYIERKTRRADIVEICEVDINTGNVKVIIHEESEPYVGIELSSIHFLNNYKDIIWWSERSGYGHLYHYDGDGNLKNAISSGNWTAGKVVEIDEKTRTIFFQAYGTNPSENPSYAKICRASIDGKGDVTVLTPEEATHEVIFSPSKKYIIDSYSRPDLPFCFTVRNAKTGKLMFDLGKIDLSSITKTGWKKPEVFSVKAADNKTDLYGVMWKPFDFDSTKKYPIVSCVYPGPQTDNVPLSFEVGSTNEALAQIGVIVVAFNHRGGVPYRGRAYHSFGYNNIRDHALADDKCGLEQLIERFSYIDSAKVGIYGHSGGGMMAAAAICTYPDFYKACVASAGNYDNNIYSQFFVENHYAIEETKVRVEDKDKIVYSTNFPTNMDLASNLKGHIMLIFGNQDGNVHPANTIRLVDAFINSGKDIDLVMLPRGRHTYDGVSSWYFEHKLRSYFAKYLLNDFTSNGFYDIEVDQYDRIINK